MGGKESSSGLSSSVPGYLEMSQYRGCDIEEERLYTSDFEPPWTSSRCQRLLRPLTSKIALLRKLKILDSNELCRSSPDAFINPSLGSSTLAPHYTKLQGFDHCAQVVNVVDDTDWTASARPRKRLRRTYSGKSRPEVPTSITDLGSKTTTKTSAEAILQLFGEDSDVQAVVRDDRRQSVLNPSQKKEPVLSRNLEPGSVDLAAQRRAFIGLAKDSCPNHWKIVAGLHDSLAALLKATAENQPATVRSIGTTRLDSLGLNSRPPEGDGRHHLTSRMSISPKNSSSLVFCEEKRARTLFATCLRKVPALIMMEQRSLKLEDPENDVDVSSAMYSDLEQLSPSNIAGWKPLKEIVRAHGIVILTDAIEESLINSHIANALLTLCLIQGAYHEAAMIVGAMATSMEPLSKPASTDSLLFSYHTSVSLHAMHTFQLKTQSSRFMYVQLARLFETHKLPLEWITTQDMVGIWKRVIVDVTTGRPDATEAVALLRVVFAIGNSRTGLRGAGAIHEIRRKSHRKHLASQKRKNCLVSRKASGLASDKEVEGEEFTKRASHVLSSLLTVISANACLSPSQTFVVTEIGQQAQQLNELTRRRHLHDIDPDKLGLSILASAITSSKNESQHLRTLAQAFWQTTPGFAVTAGSFLSNVAQCCARMTARDPYEHLHCMMKCLDSRLADNSEHKALRATYKAICVAAAFELAEKSGQPKHMERAVTLDLSMQGGNAKNAFRTPGRTPAQQREDSRTGFRWEEGISEWVAQTPLGPLVFNDPCSDNDNVDKSGYEVLGLPTNRRPSVPEPEDIGEASPCAKRHPAPEAKGGIPLKRKRGRPKKNKSESKFEKVYRSKGFEIFSVQDEGDVIISPQKGDSRNLRDLHEVFGNSEVRTEMSMGSKGAADAMFRATPANVIDGTESEDELSLGLV